jgi:catechol 2,3-dioxygenase-like lactoylglutathione lyase family enzyme
MDSSATNFPSPVTDIRAFVPARDLAQSLQFYTELGFTINWSGPEIAELQAGSFRFLLQRFYVEAHAGNFMMSLQVTDLDAWWTFIERRDIAGRYPGIMCRAPALQPWGIRVLYLSDPTGVLWHITDGRRG